MTVQDRVMKRLLERMPRRPLAGHDKKTAERRPWDDPMQALSQAFVQMNPEHRWGILSLDLDRYDADAAIADAALLRNIQLPRPNIQTWRNNGNAQAHWLLRVPVGTTAAHRIGPQVFARGVFTQLKAAYGADRSCAGRVMRGILHPNQTTRFYHADLFDLRELRAGLPSAPMEAQLGSADLGRNWQMFLALNSWALQRATQGVDPSSATFLRELQAEGHRLMTLLPQKDHAYTVAELRRTIKSVQRRTIHRVQSGQLRTGGYYIPEVEGAVLRSKQYSWARSTPLPAAKAAANMAAAREIGNARQQERALRPLLEAAQRLVDSGESLTTRNLQAELARAGIERSTRNIKKHAPFWRAVAENAPGTSKKEHAGENDVEHGVQGGG